MFDNLDDVVRHTLMKILSAIYESELVDRVDLGMVLQLFGITNDQDEDLILNFSDEEWIEEYTNFITGQNNITVFHLDELYSESVEDIGKAIIEKLFEESEDQIPPLPKKTLH